MKHILFLSGIFFVAFSCYAQVTNPVVVRTKLGRQADNFLEGYGEKIKGPEITYHSNRRDCRNALITRATNGNMDVIWETAPVPEGYRKKNLQFMWIAGLDLNHGDHVFRLDVNEKHLLDLHGGKAFRPDITGAGGSSLSFYVLSKDQFGDAFGYMVLTLPASMVEKGKPVRVSVTGGKDDSPAWYMTFLCPDAVHYLREQSRKEGWLNLKISPAKQGYTGKLMATENWLGRKLTLLSGRQKYERVLEKANNGQITAVFNLSSGLGPKKGLEILLDNTLIARLPGLFWEGEEDQTGAVTMIHDKGFFTGKDWNLEVRIIYAPEQIKIVRELSASLFRTGKIDIINSSHQDIAWMDSPEKCMIDRDTMLITPFLKKAKPESRFNMEDVLMMREYLHRHPERKVLIGQMLHTGQLQCGASYNMPYEDMYSGETLIRQFYLGKRWLEKQFPGYHSMIYWNVDVPGRTLQMPQILMKSGVPYLILSRQKEGIYHWYSPDSSFVTVYSPGHYSRAYPYLNRDFEDAVLLFGQEQKTWSPYYDKTSPAPVIPVLSDWDMSVVKDYSPLIKQWGSVKVDLSESGKGKLLKLPPVRIVSAETFLDKLGKNKVNYTSIRGERPDIWVYIHGPSHEKALTASRKGDIMLTAAEKFATINAMLEGSFASYPDEKLEKAWENKIYPDHGWGGKHGDITDAVFYDKLESSARSAEEIIHTQLIRLAGKIRTDHNKKIPLVVFNSLSWDRTGPVIVTTGFPAGFAGHIRLTDPEGTPVPFQIISSSAFPDNSLRKARLIFIAEHVPPLGYLTYYVMPAAGEVGESEPVKNGFPNSIESPYYRITLSQEGIRQITDKQLNIDLFDNSKFAVGDVITMHSYGNGAGEFADVQQPDMKNFDRSGAHHPKWNVIADGPVFTEIEYKQSLSHAIVREKVILYKTVKRIDFRTGLLNWDGTMYREFRQMFPVRANTDQVRYEVPFGSVRIGRDELQKPAGERYIYPPSETRPRGIMNWIAAETKNVTVLFSSSVAAWDYRDPTDKPLSTAVLQPVLLASRRSCNQEGNDYDQTGDHTFFFSMTSFRPDVKKDFIAGRQPNEPLFVVFNPCSSEHAGLPEEKSFLSVNRNDVLISTMKKSEDDDAVIIRYFEPAGKRAIVSLHLPVALIQAWHTNLIEEHEKEIKTAGHDLSLDITPHSIETLKIKIKEPE